VILFVSVAVLLKLSFRFLMGFSKSSYTAIPSHVEVDKIAAIKLYEAMGFSITSRKSPFRKDGGDAFEMAKSLETSDSSTSRNSLAWRSP